MEKPLDKKQYDDADYEYEYDDVEPVDIEDNDRNLAPDDEIMLLAPFVIPKSTTSKERRIINDNNRVKVQDVPTRYRERAITDFATGNLSERDLELAKETWTIMVLTQDYGRRNILDLSPLHNAMHEILLGDMTLSKSHLFALLKEFRKTSSEQISKTENTNYDTQKKKEKWSILPKGGFK